MPKSKHEKVAEAGVEKASDRVYYVDGDGDVASAKMAKRGRRAAPRKEARTGIRREPGYLYFVDRAGDVARVPMARRRNTR
jgi:hypothetical protein